MATNRSTSSDRDTTTSSDTDSTTAELVVPPAIFAIRLDSCLSSVGASSRIDKNFEATLTSSERIFVQKGAYGTVCRIDFNGLPLAIKEVPYMRGEDVGQHSREIAIMSEIARMRASSTSVPNYIAVQFFGFYVDNNVNIVMEYMPYDLKNYISKHRNNAPPLSKRVEIMIQLARAVKYLHTIDIIHGDIKANNILYDDSDGSHVKLCDFATSSKTSDPDPARGPTCDFYSAPELYNLDKNLEYAKRNFASDVFSLTIVLFELCTWKRAHNNCTDGNGKKVRVSEFLKAGKREAIPSDIPPGIAKLITFGWHQDPAQRPSAKKLQDDLKEEYRKLRAF